MVRPAHMDRNRQYDYHPLDLTLAKCMMSAVRRTECLVRALCPKKRKRERALLRRVFGSSFSSNSHTPLPPPSPFFFLVKGISCAVLSIKKRKLETRPSLSSATPSRLLLPSPSVQRASLNIAPWLSLPKKENEHHHPLLQDSTYKTD